MNQNVTLPERQGVSHNALPDSWIDRIFMQMSVLYGSKLSGLWSGSNLEDVKRGWAEKLGGFREMPGAIKEALDALDSKPYPPTLPEFIALCREAARPVSYTHLDVYKRQGQRRPWGPSARWRRCWRVGRPVRRGQQPLGARLRAEPLRAQPRQRPPDWPP